MHRYTVAGRRWFWQDRISTLGSHNSRGQWRTRSVTASEPACRLRLQLQRTLGYNQQLESNLEEKGDSRAGLRSANGTTPYPWGLLGQWQTSRECHRFLRWGHAGPLSESWAAFSALRIETSLQRLWRSITRLLAGYRAGYALHQLHLPLGSEGGAFGALFNAAFADHFLLPENCETRFAFL